MSPQIVMLSKKPNKNNKNVAHSLLKFIKHSCRESFICVLWILCFFNRPKASLLSYRCDCCMTIRREMIWFFLCIHKGTHIKVQGHAQTHAHVHTHTQMFSHTHTLFLLRHPAVSRPPSMPSGPDAALLSLLIHTQTHTHPHPCPQSAGLQLAGAHSVK